MAKVTLSKEAQRDIIAIRNYIRDELCNPSAAKHIIACLKKSIQSLEKFSGRGRPLDALLSVHTEYRYLVCENYCIFYLEDNERVIIVRILHQRQDSLRALFLEKYHIDQGRPSPFRERRPIILPLISPPSSAESAHSPHCADQRAMRWWR